MIVLHRITHPGEPFHLNPDLIQTVESTPDTVVALVNSSKFVVIESPAEIAQLVREWRASIARTAAAMQRGNVPPGGGDVIPLPPSRG